MNDATTGAIFMAYGEAQAALRRRAERELEPYLQRLAEAQEEPAYDGEYGDRMQDALDHALALLGVTR